MVNEKDTEEYKKKFCISEQELDKIMDVKYTIDADKKKGMDDKPKMTD